MGRQMSDTIDMEMIAELVRRAGYVAYVEQTGGGVATIYASKTADAKGWPATHEVDGDPRFEAVAGPGWFEKPGWLEPRGSLADFYVGIDDQGETEPYAATASDNEASLAQKILETLRGEVTYPVRS